VAAALWASPRYCVLDVAPQRLDRGMSFGASTIVWLSFLALPIHVEDVSYLQAIEAVASRPMAKPAFPPRALFDRQSDRTALRWPTLYRRSVQLRQTQILAVVSGTSMVVNHQNQIPKSFRSLVGEMLARQS